MRNFLAVILAIVAGLTASLGLIAWKLNGVTHQPEPVQDILGSGEAADQLKAAVPDALGNMASESIDVAVLDEAVNSAVSSAAQHVTSKDDFDEAWAQSLEQTRTGWVDQIDSLQEEMDAGEPIADNSTDAQLQWHLDPVAEVAVSDINDAVADVTGSASNMQLEPKLTINTSIPPVSMLTAEQTVLATQLMTLWPVLLVLAGIVFLIALLIGSGGSRWIVWLVTGVVTAVCGMFAKFGFSQMQHVILDRAENTPHLVLLRPFLRAVQDWADPQLIVLMVAGAGVALLGILGGFISSNRRRARY